MLARTLRNSKTFNKISLHSSLTPQKYLRLAQACSVTNAFFQMRNFLRVLLAIHCRCKRDAAAAWCCLIGKKFLLLFWNACLLWTIKKKLISPCIIVVSSSSSVIIADESTIFHFRFPSPDYCRAREVARYQIRHTAYQAAYSIYRIGDTRVHSTQYTAYTVYRTPYTVPVVRATIRNTYRSTCYVLPSAEPSDIVCLQGADASATGFSEKACRYPSLPCIAHVSRL
jgi:hypothetical protein